MYKNQRVGVNTVKNMLPNHSLRATSITCMFNSGLQEKVIPETSGHKSVKALRCYERTSTAQQQEVTASVKMEAN